MNDKENCSPQNIFGSSVSKSTSSNRTRYKQIEPQGFDQIENILDESANDIPSRTTSRRKNSEFISIEINELKPNHIKKLSDDDIVLYKEEEPTKSPGCFDKLLYRLTSMCKCNHLLHK